jgi:hypothetical protein
LLASYAFAAGGITGLGATAASARLLRVARAFEHVDRCPRINETVTCGLMSMPTIAPQQLRVVVNPVPGFTPPPQVVALGQQGIVDVDLLLGAQLLWTVVMGKSQVSYGDVYNWMSLSVQGRSPHQFADSSFGDDSEVGGDLSSTFSKLVGLAFLGKYAATSWFKVLRPLWGETLSTGAGPVHIDKPRPKDDGPDYLAAPFDPSSAPLGGPFYAVELKGRKAKVEFSSDVFKNWSSQASNIALSAASGPLNLKSWIVAFNYGFSQARGSREESTLLVEDPEISTGAPLLEATRENGASIIRDHLARQCVNLGAGVLASAVKLGTGLDATTPLPRVYRVDHPRLLQRQYVGQWYSPNNLGELTPAAFPLTPWSPSGLEVVEHGPGFFVVRWPRARAEVFIHSEASSWLDRRGPQNLLRRLFGAGDSIFVGQDATMLRSAARTQQGNPLDGTPFSDELHFNDTIGDDAYQGQVLARTDSCTSMRAMTCSADPDDAHQNGRS